MTTTTPESVGIRQVWCVYLVGILLGPVFGDELLMLVVLAHLTETLTSTGRDSDEGWDGIRKSIRAVERDCLVVYLVGCRMGSGYTLT